jgi:hypothetical protein
MRSYVVGHEEFPQLAAGTNSMTATIDKKNMGHSTEIPDIQAKQSFCPSCGRGFEDLNCGIDHDMTPAMVDSSIGSVMTYRRAFRRRQAVVVDVLAKDPIVVESDSSVERPLKRKASAP